MKKVHVIVCAVLLLSVMISCVSTNSIQTSDHKDSTQTFLEEANGREVFVFLPAGDSSSKQEFMITGHLYPKAGSSRWITLTNREYYGVMGYLVSDIPEKKNGREFYKIKLSTGKECYYTPLYKNSDFSLIYDSEVFTYEDYLKGNDKISSKSPIFEGSTIYYVAGDGLNNFELSNGVKVIGSESKKKFDDAINIASFANTCDARDKIFTIIMMNSDINCTYDNLDKYGILNWKWKPSGEDYEVLYLSINPYVIKLDWFFGIFSSSWINSNSITVSNGINRYDNQNISIVDKTSNGYACHEIICVEVDEKLEVLLQESLETRALLVRVRGKDGFKDYSITEKDFRKIETILQLYHLLKQ